MDIASNPDDFTLQHNMAAWDDALQQTQEVSLRIRDKCGGRDSTWVQ